MVCEKLRYSFRKLRSCSLYTGKHVWYQNFEFLSLHIWLKSPRYGVSLKSSAALMFPIQNFSGNRYSDLVYVNSICSKRQYLYFTIYNMHLPWRNCNSRVQVITTCLTVTEGNEKLTWLLDSNLYGICRRVANDSSFSHDNSNACLQPVRLHFSYLAMNMRLRVAISSLLTRNWSFLSANSFFALCDLACFLVRNMILYAYQNAYMLTTTFWHTQYNTKQMCVTTWYLTWSAPKTHF